MDLTNVLIVDSDRLYRQMFIDAFSETEIDRNFKFFVASDGKQALNFLSENRMDIIFTEIYLPYADGYHIIESNPNPACINIISSFETCDFIKEMCFEKRIDFVFIKPFEKDILKKRLKSVIRNKNKIFTNYQKEKVNFEVSRLLAAIGIPANITGYKYLRSAIIKVVEDENRIKGITKVLYPEIASEYGATPARVERNIRTAIEVAYDRGNIKLQDKIFGYTINENRGKPTNSEFIAMIADRISLKFLRIF